MPIPARVPPKDRLLIAELMHKHNADIAMSDLMFVWETDATHCANTNRHLRLHCMQIDGAVACRLHDGFGAI
jgi:hypothetical protein